MTNKERGILYARETIYNTDYGFPNSSLEREFNKTAKAFTEGANWKDAQFKWNERMKEVAIKDKLTNKEFRKMLEELPDDAYVCVECCNPRAMVYDKEYNLIRID